MRATRAASEAELGKSPYGVYDIAANDYTAEKGISLAADVGSALRAWGHVRMFSPWRFNTDQPLEQVADFTWHQLERARMERVFLNLIANHVSARVPGEDAFRFVLTREEFLDLFLDDLELPEMAKRRLVEAMDLAGELPGLTAGVIRFGEELVAEPVVDSTNHGKMPMPATSSNAPKDVTATMKPTEPQTRTRP